ncbi:carbohydrate ABC transporter permease [Microbacterium azadirachtae]|jgi:raffinose/stachyose/melibiose transport system permease protein|uniref:carbohydrate ABC transporter permease n=1 Tax=Microbacterium azadirachtae TaxID=582680 RepID=UPI000886B61F|nr:carbohydrate ABC transporter permease [Microbacterium azadirachtae]SDM16953.1 carbohydrate ABC transporter membrane protein 2, CUT1 family [Microbacterium azadirachtae]SEG40038.1 carbohydrate ABC transporter membrane protein 2, CUT1 family [Microbacterium azadirachtae]SEG43107.1 carbohydrate ABC transporter membrane protein 2, CUT1 family [Microbacterium azadirachtae]
MTTDTLRTTAVVQPRGRRGERRSEKAPWGSPGLYLIAIVLVTICITPVLYIIIGGFRTNSQITKDPSGFPAPWQFANYSDVLAGSEFWTALLNSTIVAIGTTLGAVLLGVMAAYVLARYEFAAKPVMYSLFAAGLMFPVTVAITPLYLLIRNLGLVNSLAGIIVPQIAFALPGTIIILVPFLKAIPKELEEAAAIDGASRLGFFWRMVIPLSLPGVVTVGILAFVGSWNGYMLPLFILNDPNLFTLPLGVQNFSSQYSVDTARVLAYTSLSMLPALIFFSLFERRIVGGLTGAVKG